MPLTMIKARDMKARKTQNGQKEGGQNHKRTNKDKRFRQTDK